MIEVTITLEEDNLRFIDQQAKGNRSGYINALLRKHRYRILEEQMIQALKKDALLFKILGKYLVRRLHTSLSLHRLASNCHTRFCRNLLFEGIGSGGDRFSSIS
jgi:hypothetical protein